MNGLAIRWQIESALLGAGGGEGAATMDPQTIDQFGRNWGLAGILLCAFGWTLWKTGGWFGPLIQLLIVAREKKFTADAELAEALKKDVDDSRQRWIGLIERQDRMERELTAVVSIIRRRCGRFEIEKDGDQ